MTDESCTKRKNQRTKGKDVFFCVLESNEGARIISASEAGAYSSRIRDEDLSSVVHFAGDHAAAVALQKFIESRMAAKSLVQGLLIHLEEFCMIFFIDLISWYVEKSMYLSFTFAL